MSVRRKILQGLQLKTNLVVSSLLFVVTLITMVAVSRATPGAGGLTEGLLIEANLKQGTRSIEGRVLVEAGRTEWTTIATAPAAKSEPALRLEARANLIDSDVVEVETRVIGRDERTGKFLIQLGNRSELNQLEGATGAAGEPATSVAVKVLRVRYSL